MIQNHFAFEHDIGKNFHASCSGPKSIILYFYGLYLNTDFCHAKYFSGTLCEMTMKLFLLGDSLKFIKSRKLLQDLKIQRKGNYVAVKVRHFMNSVMKSR